MNQNPADGVIRITKEEASSTHVDDLLKRQMSLRGETGVTRDHGRRWYLQNWFVFGLVGLIGAIVAWAILEPFYDDMMYVQGPVSGVTVTDDLKFDLKGESGDDSERISVQGTFSINGQKLVVPHGVKELRGDKKRPRVDLDSIHNGEVIGVYVRLIPSRETPVPVVHFIERNPKPLPPERAKMTLEQLYSRHNAAAMLFFPLVAGLIGLFIGAADGFVCRLPRRALLAGGVGLLVGFIGGFLSSLAAEVIYTPLTHLAMKQHTGASETMNSFGFVIQILGRSLAWCMAGLAMGLGQGIALRSTRLLVYGLLGGVVGGLFGGLLFDPIDLLILGADKPSAHVSRLIGFGVIGLSVGIMIGVVELLARDAWLRMTQGPLSGKEFLLFKDVMKVGSSPRSDVYLFNDPLVAPDHATIRAVGDEVEIEAHATTHPVVLNNRPVPRARLRHGDNVTIGRTVFVFQRRKG